MAIELIDVTAILVQGQAGQANQWKHDDRAYLKHVVTKLIAAVAISMQ